MKYFKIITPDIDNMDGETNDHVGEKIKASEKMHKDRGVSVLFSRLSPKEISALRNYRKLKGVE